VHGVVHRYPPTDAWACLQVFTVFILFYRQIKTSYIEKKEMLSISFLFLILFISSDKLTSTNAGIPLKQQIHRMGVDSLNDGQISKFKRFFKSEGIFP